MPDGARVRRIEPPAGIRRLRTLPRADYEDAFELTLGPAVPVRTAEQWIREMLEGAPANTRGRLVLGWTALGLRLGSRDDPGRVLGWEVRSSEPDAVVLGAESRIGMPAELLLLREPERLVFSTQVRHGNPAVRVLWATVEQPHLRIVPALLAAAGERVAEGARVRRSRAGGSAARAGRPAHDGP